MDQNSLLKIPGSPARGIISTPAVLAGPEDVNQSAPTERQDILNEALEISLEEIMDRLQLESNSGRCHVSRSILTCPKKSSDIQVQHGDKKGEISIGIVHT